ncbi:MAG: 50S ribosomal protein L1 [Chlorobi bacterium]|nr:50S ribosomal protein L1 [Chlorobiota bacterium]
MSQSATQPHTLYRRKLTKKQQQVYPKVDRTKKYSLEEASKLVKEVSYANFDATVELHVRLGVDPSKPEQMVRGTITLPHGTGKKVRVLALVTPEDEEKAKEAGADYVGLDEYIQKIKEGWLDFDVVLATPPAMKKVAQIARILGPRGLMPTPKAGTVVKDIAQAIKEVKKGRISYKMDKYGIVHVPIGKVSFAPEQIKDNAEAVLKALLAAKPSAAKGQYFRSIYMAPTMGPGIPINPKVVQ